MQAEGRTPALAGERRRARARRCAHRPLPSHPAHPRTHKVKETASFHVAKLAFRDADTRDDLLVLLPTVEDGGGAAARCHMRSLGYMGSFLLAYASAQASGRNLFRRGCMRVL